MMKFKATINNPGGIECTLAITMTLNDWGDLRDQLTDKYPSWKLTQAINDLTHQTRQTFYPQIEGDEDGK